MTPQNATDTYHSDTVLMCSPFNQWSVHLTTSFIPTDKFNFGEETARTRKSDDNAIGLS
jgi:hypothetical protein